MTVLSNSAITYSETKKCMKVTYRPKSLWAVGKEGYVMADKNPKHMLKKKQTKAKEKKKHIYE